MKKLFAYSLILSIIFSLMIATASVAQRKYPHSKVVNRIPARPHVLVPRTTQLKDGIIWVDGHYKWNKRTHSYIWVKARYVKNTEGKTWYKGCWKPTRGGWKYVPGFWA